MTEKIKALQNNEGITLKDGKEVTYKSGWQVADYGKECFSVDEVMTAIDEYKGTCGIWLSDGVYYVDHSFRVNTKKEALTIGKRFNQISVFGWRKKVLAYC